MKILDEPVVFIDIETSGSSYKTSRVIEIGALRMEDGNIVDTFKTFVNPGANLPHWITELTGISDHDLVQAPYFEDIAYQLEKFLEGAVFCAHNVRFDYSYIKHEFAEVGYNYQPKLLCTVRLSRTLYPEHKGHSLEKIINRHGIQVAARHRAFDDALAIKTFSDIAYQEKGPEKFSWAVGKQFAKATIPPNVKDTEVQAIPNKPGVYIFEDQEHRPLYIGKSVAMRSRVLSHFREDVNQAKEMKLSKSVRGVRTIETKNELEALLLESSLVKSLQPIHNKQLRPAERYFVLAHTINEQGYMSVRLEDIELSEQTDFRAIFGIYTSKAKAKTALENSARTFDLCPKLLGLDQAKQACFHYQLGKCKGACVGKEKPQLYNLRTQLAFQSSKITPWPYKSAVAIYDKQENGVVVRNWVILGYVATLSSGETEYRQVTQAFDLDSYRILRSYIPQPRLSYTIAPVDPNLLQQSGASFITPVDYSQVF